jgi:hypothetical protein
MLFAIMHPFLISDSPFFFISLWKVDTRFVSLCGGQRVQQCQKRRHQGVVFYYLNHSMTMAEKL